MHIYIYIYICIFIHRPYHCSPGHLSSSGSRHLCHLSSSPLWRHGFVQRPAASSELLLYGFHTHMHTCVRMYVRTYIHTHIHTYVHIHTYIHTHIHTHTYTQTYTMHNETYTIMIAASSRSIIISN